MKVGPFHLACDLEEHERIEVVDVNGRLELSVHRMSDYDGRRRYVAHLAILVADDSYPDGSRDACSKAWWSRATEFRAHSLEILERKVVAYLADARRAFAA